MFRVDVTWLGYYMAAVSVYYIALFVLSTRVAARREPPSSARPGMALIVPAHNEEAVIASTLDSLVQLDYNRYCVIVVNDGSTDRTAEVAREFESTGRVLVVDRPPEVAGQGKGAVLNEGYRTLNELIENRDPHIAGFDLDDAVVGVVDADGRLEPQALQEVAQLFTDRHVGGVQMGVVIGNAEDRLITRCQDLEFTGFCQLAQAARDRIGSVGLGGNGQFTRLAALGRSDVLPGQRVSPRTSISASTYGDWAGTFASAERPPSRRRASVRCVPGSGSGRDGRRGTTSAGTTSRSCSRPGTCR
jgi:cellulose synthase/poly-beta-1,6-N-acetylglucosamine synthase-like glycosyltransferase